MCYLTYHEYLELGFSRIKEESLFSELEPHAERQLDLVTKNHYLKMQLNEDPNPYRVKKFKLAMALQIDYLNMVGGKTQLFEVLNEIPSSVTIGRMKIDRGKLGASVYGRTMLSSDAYAELSATGLVYQGVDYR
jgi:hypothetical protein